MRFAGASGVLTGTLQVPPEPVAPWAAAVFLHGSGPQDRDGNGPGLALHLFDTLAADLAGIGVASVRYDKRGVGESPGDLLACTVQDLAADGRAAMRFVRRLHETARLPVFLVGHSEGTTIGLLLGGEPPIPAGLVLLAPALTPMEDVLRLQAAGVQAAVARLAPAERQRLGIPEQFDQRRVTAQMISAIRALPPEQPTLTMGTQTVPARWFRSHFDLDLHALAASVRCPLLAIGGAKDTQLPPRDAEALAAVAREGGTADATGLVLADLTHVLRRSAGSGAAGEYAELVKAPLDAELRGLVTAWLVSRRPTEG